MCNIFSVNPPKKWNLWEKKKYVFSIENFKPKKKSICIKMAITDRPFSKGPV